MTAEIRNKDLGNLREALPAQRVSRDLRGLDVIIQLLKYALVGVVNTLIDASAYFGLTRWLGLASLPVLTKGITYTLGMVNSFYWNRTWTFRSRSNLWRAGVLFILTHVFALGINAGAMALMYNFLHCTELLALGVATAASFGWSFILNRWLVFR
jgi:putative flippase GtrA